MAAFAAALFAGGALYLYTAQKQEVVLDFAMFNGSNWKVAIQDSYPVIDQAIAKFEAEHPGVTVRYESGIPKDDYSEWLSRRMLADETPDVMMILDEDFGTFARLGMLERLDSWISRDKTFRAGDYYDTALLSGQIENGQYALPMETVPTLMFVNKTLLNQENIAMPAEDYTFAELYDICRKVTKDLDGDGQLDQFGIYKYTWTDAAMANGAELFSADGRSCDFTTQELLSAIRFVKNLNELAGNQKVTQETFDSGRVAFMPLSYAEYRTYKSYPYRIKKYSEFQWDCLPMPRGPSGDNVSIVDSLNVGISSRSRNKELAWEFLKLLTGDPEIQTALFETMPAASVLPAVTGAAEGEDSESAAVGSLENGSREHMADAVQDEAVSSAGEADGRSGTGSSAADDAAGKDELIDGSFISRIISEGRTKPKFASYQEAMQLADGEIQKLYDEETDMDNAMRLIQRKVQNFISR